MALSQSKELVAEVAYDNGFSHAENLHPFIKQLFDNSGVKMSALSAIAVSKGPGSYTGLRIGVSAAKGLAFSLKVPLISVDTLQVMAIAAKKIRPDLRYFCPMIDARRMEVYTAIYNNQFEQLSQTEALIIDESSIHKYANYNDICFFGNGYAKAKSTLEKITSSHFIDGIVPEAANMLVPALNKFEKKQFEDLLYFEPFYLKDFLILKKPKA